MRVKSGYFKNREQEMELFFNTPKLNWLLYSDPIKKTEGKKRWKSGQNIFRGF